MCLTLKLKLVNHAVQIGEIFQFPNASRSDGTGEGDQKVGSTMGQLRNAGVLDDDNNSPYDVACKVGANPGVGTVLFDRS